MPSKPFTSLNRPLLELKFVIDIANKAWLWLLIDPDLKMNIQNTHLFFFSYLCLLSHKQKYLMKKITDTISYFLDLKLYHGESLEITIGTIVFVIVCFVLTWLGLKLLKKGVLRFFSIVDKGRLHSVFNFVNYFVYIIIFFFLLNAIGVNINMFLTTTAALFVGLGFALQKIFQDLIAGIYILLDNTLHIGDVIEIDGKVAQVKVINLRSTIAETRNRRIIVIPNRRFVDDVVNNWTQDSAVIRAGIEVGVYIDSDVPKVREILLQSLEGNPDVLDYPAPLVMLDKFGESSIRFFLYYFIDNSFDNDKIASDIRFQIDHLFKKNGIKLPVPVLRIEK